MTSLARFTIVVSASHRGSAEAPALSLQRAGAVTQICSPQVDLWATLADRSFDAIVIVIGPEDDSPMSAYAPLYEDPRARGLPCLLLISPRASLTIESLGALNAVSLLPSDCDDAQLQRTVAGLVEGRRRILEYEAAVRELAEGLRSETRRADSLAKKLGNLSHDVRGMLAVAYGFCCNLRDGVVAPGSDAERLHVSRILEALEGSTRLLESSSQTPTRASPSGARRLSSVGPQRVQRSLVHLGRLAREVLALLEQRAHSRQVRLLVESDDTVSVWADALKLKQVVVNLVDNAVKYGAPGGEVTVRVQWARPATGSGKHSRRLARITVSDRGPGIAPEHRERIFERGYRGAQTDPSTGQGIGLDLVREIVVQHRGQVQCTDAEGGGAEFHVTLPADLRERDRPGLMILRDTQAAAALAKLLESTQSSEWRSAPLRDKDIEELGHLARECAAIVLTPANHDSVLEDLLAQLAQPSVHGLYQEFHDEDATTHPARR